MSLFGFLTNLLRSRQPLPSPAPVQPDPLLSVVNSLRSGQGLSPLARDTRLEVVALSHSLVMAKHQSLSHDGLPDGTPADRLAKAHIPWSAEGEVIALAPDPQTALSLWEKSGPHFKILTGPFTLFGAAHTDSYWCAVLIS